MFYDWNLSQVHTIDFVLVDTSGNEVAGLGTTWTIELAKAGGSFAAGTGTKAELSDGWYRYTNVAGEADTIGQVDIKITHGSIAQQNLIAVVENLQPNAVAYTYTVTNSVTTDPVAGVEVWITTDIGGSNIVMTGLTTDAAGVAKDADGNLPYLDPGTYYFWKQKAGFTDDQNPDTEVVS